MELESAARARHAQAYRPGTRINHQVQWSKYVTFCKKFGFQPLNPAIHTVILYVETLAQQFCSPDSVKNYVSGIKHHHNVLGRSCNSLESFEVRTMLRALDLTMHHTPNRRRPITPTILKNMLRLCQQMGSIGIMLKVALLFGFHAFLRQSNIVPPSEQEFDPTRHTCRGDIFMQPPGLVMLQKWTKTNQSGKNVTVIPIPSNINSLVCPVKAYQDLLAITPAHDNAPLLLLPGTSRHITVDITMLKQEFVSINLPNENQLVQNRGFLFFLAKHNIFRDRVHPLS